MTQAGVKRERIQADPAGFIAGEIKEFIATDPSAKLDFMDGYLMFDEPLVQFAAGDDSLFTQYKEIIDPVHLTPREALAAEYEKSPEEMPERVSVISWILPITEETRQSNRQESKGPSRLWSHTRYYGEKANEALRKHILGLLRDAGYLATAPQIAAYFKTQANDNGMFSNWSERHAAYAAGLGTFSLSDGFITEKGIAHRCGSVITDLVLPASPRTAAGPYTNCLHYVEVDCRSCINRCPAGAISEAGHDKKKCQQYLNGLGYPASLKNGYNIETSVAGCGLCQAKVPCEFRNPTAKMKSRP